MDIKTQKTLADIVLNANKKTVKPYITTATVKSITDNTIYVSIPGSDSITPVKASSVSVNPGDVVDLVVSHNDTHITGNRSDVATSASTTENVSKALEASRLEMDNQFDMVGNKITAINNTIDMQNSTIEMQGSTIISINDKVNSQNNVIEQQGNTITQLGNTVNQQGNTITEVNNKVESYDNTITQMENTITQQGNTITEVNNKVTSQGNTITEMNDKITSQGNTINSQGNTITEMNSTIETLNSTVQTQGSSIETLDSSIKIVNSAFVIQNGKLTGISEILTNILDSDYVTTDLLNANVAWIENGKIKEGAIGTVEIHDSSITTAKIAELSADVIKTGTLKTECLILTTDEVDPKTGEKKVALITALNAKTKAGEGNILDGAVIKDETIEAAKIKVVDLEAFGATIGNFNIGTSSMYNNKTALTDPTDGVYIGTDGIALGQGSLLNMTDDSPFRVESNGDFHLGGKNSNYVNFNAFSGELDINAESIKMGSSSLASQSYVDQKAEGITHTVEDVNGRLTTMEQNADGFTWSIDQTAIVSSVNEYYPSTSATELTGGSWSENTPTWTQGTYIWLRIKTTNGKGKIDYSKPVCITGNTGAQGAKGDTGEQGPKGEKGDTGEQGPRGLQGLQGEKGEQGATGADGRGIIDTTVTYQEGSSGTTVPTGTWSTSVPSTTADKPYLWTKTVTNYTSGNPTTAYSVGSTPEGIVVGGRNLFRQSGHWDTKPTWWVANGGGLELDTSVKYMGYNTIKTTVGNGIAGNYNRYFEVDTNKIYTYSAMIKLTGDNYTGTPLTPLNCHCSSTGTDFGDNDGIDVIKYKQDLVNGEWTLLYLTFRPKGKYFRPFIYIGYGTRVFNIAYLKLEEGNKATDWTPAPEDVEAATAEAAKTATNYMKFSSDGLVVGDMTADTLGKNVLIDSDSVDIRNDSTVLASYGENIVLRHGGKDAFTIKTSTLIESVKNVGRYLEATSEIYSTIYIMGAFGSKALTKDSTYIWHIKKVNKYAIFAPSSDMTITELYYYSDQPEYLGATVSGATKRIPCSYADETSDTELRIDGSIWIDSLSDASGKVQSIPPLGIGVPDSAHLEIDSNEIAAKSNTVTPSALNINMEGGAVTFNNNASRALKYQDGALYGRYSSTIDSLGMPNYSSWYEALNVFGDKNFQNIRLGYGTYARQTGSTQIYGNDIELISLGISSNRPLKTLWSGAWYMQSGQTATLTDKVTDQLNGIVLVWSKYSGGPQNYEWNCFFIPKEMVGKHPGAGYSLMCIGNWPSYKYIYVNNQSITGSTANSSNHNSINGVNYDSKNHVLRYVFGV